MTPPITRVDSYKYSHFKQYKPGMEYISSYIEARGVEPGRDWKVMVNAGLAYYYDRYLAAPFIVQWELDLIKDRVAKHGVSFNTEGFQYVIDNYGGFLPLRIQALPEGMVVPLGTPILQAVNTDPKCAWATSFVETNLMRLWYPSTVATLSYHIKKLIKASMLKTAGHTEGLDFKLHDFGARGVSSSESAQIGGIAHLMNFMGSDTFEAIQLAEEIYNEDMAGYSIDAAEHSTITSFGGPAHEIEAFEHMLKTFGIAGKLFAVVSDSYDIWDAVENKWGGVLKDQVINLGKIGSKLVVRPDSGDPVITPVEVIERLMGVFGYTVNQKGFKVLPPYIGVIQGDGINETSIRQILSLMQMKGLSAENINFGMGGGLLQQVNRDTLKFAMKASAAKNINFNGGEWYDVQKDPITDKGKKSKAGRQAVSEVEGHIWPVREETLFANKETNLLVDVYNNGPINGYKSATLAEIRERINGTL